MIGVIILAHNQLERVEALARYLADQSCAIVLHIDKSADGKAVAVLQDALKDIENVAFCERHRCEWGRFSLVEAALTGSELMLRQFPEVEHVALISGSCLPVRPIAELSSFLRDNPDTDFIESVLAEQDGWVKDGLSAERFTLYFPFSWQKQRWLFDRFVDLQRKLGICRKMPTGLAPHIGLQWWCLSESTLAKILGDENLPEIKRFFKLTWIPDESFFQTMARKHGKKVVSKPLTFVKFDSQGKPFIFYDDHLPLLQQVDAFFARKIWPGAEMLYREMLASKPGVNQSVERTSDPMIKAVTRSVNLRSRGRPGLISQNRYTSRWYEQVFATARPYYVFDGFDRFFPGFLEGLRKGEGLEMHGHLFGPDKVDFVDDSDVFAGNLTSGSRLRDYRPDQFLVNLIWGRRQILQGFLHDLSIPDRVRRHILRDANAQIIRISDAWMADVFLRSEGDPKEEAVLFRLYEAEANTLTEGFEDWELQSDFLEISLLDLLEKPVRTARRIQTVLPPETDIRPAIDTLVAPKGFSDFLIRMSEQGFEIPRLPELLRELDTIRSNPLEQKIRSV